MQVFVNVHSDSQSCKSVMSQCFGQKSVLIHDGNLFRAWPHVNQLMSPLCSSDPRWFLRCSLVKNIFSARMPVRSLRCQAKAETPATENTGSCTRLEWHEQTALPHLWCLFEQSLYQTACQNKTKNAETPRRGPPWKTEQSRFGELLQSVDAVSEWDDKVLPEHSGFGLMLVVETDGRSGQQGKRWSTFTGKSQKKSERVEDLTNVQQVHVGAACFRLWISVYCFRKTFFYYT